MLRFLLKKSVKTVAFLKIMIYNIKAVCRDGGAVERARFEIVLCRNVYKGSNPFLCAKKDRVEPVSSTRSFSIHYYAIISRNFAFRLCYRSIERGESKREKLLLL